MQFLPSSGHVDTAVWMHYLDANKMAGEEARQQLYKNTASNIELVLVATPHKAPTKQSWRSRDELISDVLLWTRTYGRAKAGRDVAL